MNILGIGQDKSQSAYFSRRLQEPEYETEEGQGLPHTPRRGVGLAAPRHGVVAPGTPSVSLFAYKKPSDLKTSGGSTFFHEKFRCTAATEREIRGTEVSVPAPCRDGEVPPEPSPSISITISINVADSHDEEGVVLSRG